MPRMSPREPGEAPMSPRLGEQAPRTTGACAAGRCLGATRGRPPQLFLRRKEAFKPLDKFTSEAGKRVPVTTESSLCATAYTKAL